VIGWITGQWSIRYIIPPKATAILLAEAGNDDAKKMAADLKFQDTLRQSKENHGQEKGESLRQGDRNFRSGLRDLYGDGL